MIYFMCKLCTDKAIKEYGWGPERCYITLEGLENHVSRAHPDLWVLRPIYDEAEEEVENGENHDDLRDV